MSTRFDRDVRKLLGISDSDRPLTKAIADKLYAAIGSGGGSSSWGSITGTLSNQTDLQTALNGKAASSHTHAQSDVTNLVSDLAGKAASSHTHAQSDITGLVSALAAKSELQAWGVLQSDYTLTSQTAAQKLFNFSSNGALTLTTGLYLFECLLYLTTMSATSGNGQFSILGAGNAVLQTSPPPLYSVVGVDNSSPLGNASATGSMSATEGSNASMLTANTGTGLAATIRGRFAVTTAGTIIPSIALVTAAAAVVKAGSYFMCQRIGAHNAATQGSWS